MGKRVAWVELYLDLVFVLAVAQLAHLIAAEPDMPSVWIALGLFVTLWWTWVGFAVLYNRHGADEIAQRLVFVIASVPTGVAAVALEPAAAGDSTAFALSLAAIRVVLAVAYARTGDRRVTRAYLVSAALFVVSVWAPEPFRYVLWAFGIGIESSAMLPERGRGRGRARGESEALDPHHFAERFGLFLIILLGEVVVEAGQASEGHVDTLAGWTALAAAMLLAAALWWLYFDSAAELNLKVLELSGGSPTIARAIFAGGHMLPAFALLITAAGIGLLLEDDPPKIAYWLASIGIGIYLAGTRAFLLATELPRVVGTVLLIATFFLARVGFELTPYAYVWLLTAWVVVWAALTTRTSDRDEEALVQRFLRHRRG
jgi:low temperature requirement protein LtrA